VQLAQVKVWKRTSTHHDWLPTSRGIKRDWFCIPKNYL